MDKVGGPHGRRRDDNNSTLETAILSDLRSGKATTIIYYTQPLCSSQQTNKKSINDGNLFWSASEKTTLYRTVKKKKNKVKSNEIKKSNEK